jgi:hypothetical protein
MFWNMHVRMKVLYSCRRMTSMYMHWLVHTFMHLHAWYLHMHMHTCMCTIRAEKRWWHAVEESWWWQIPCSQKNRHKHACSTRIHTCMHVRQVYIHVTTVKKMVAQPVVSIRFQDWYLDMIHLDMFQHIQPMNVHKRVHGNKWKYVCVVCLISMSSYCK